MRFRGKLKNLEFLIATEFRLKETKKINYAHQIKTQEGGIVNWYPKTGTVLVQGKEHIRKKINDYLKKSLD